MLEASKELDSRAKAIQGQRELLVPETEIEALVQDYHEWLALALSILPEQFQEGFRAEYEGNWFQSRIKQFFEAPGEPNILYSEETANLLPYWAHTFEDDFHKPLLKQRQILIEAKLVSEGEGGMLTHLALLERLTRRLPDLLAVLGNRQRGRTPYVVEDEYDLQDIVHGILKLHFDDVRVEDFAPERAGGRSRIDFVLKDERLVVETKMTRAGLGPREVGEELIIDIERYRSHPDCSALIGLVYDPERRIVNPRTLEADLSGPRDGIAVRVLVVR